MFYKNDILKTLESLQSDEVLSVKAKKRKEQQINEFLVRTVTKHGLVEQNVCPAKAIRTLTLFSLLTRILISIEIIIVHS